MEAFYFSAAAGRARITLGNRRFGEGGFMAAGRQRARPVPQPRAGTAKVGGPACLQHPLAITAHAPCAAVNREVSTSAVACACMAKQLQACRAVASTIRALRCWHA